MRTPPHIAGMCHTRVHAWLGQSARALCALGLGARARATARLMRRAR